MTFCQCGCGLEVNEGRRYVGNHYQRIQKEKAWQKKLEEIKKEKGKPPKLCACGCKQEVTKRTNDYIKGHYLRKKKNLRDINKEEKFLKLCACGCGEKINSKKNNYKRGHLKRLPEKESQYCYCGCGKLASPGKTYIRGHANRKHHKTSEPSYPKLCQCGCGDFAKLGNKFILGHQSAATRWRASERMKGKILSPKGSYGKGQHYQSPYQERVYLRSSYEIKYAEYLDENNIDWLYECETFDLGNTTYTPDFYLIKSGRFIEIKGWMRPESQRKIDAFRKYFFDEKLEVLFKEDLIKLGIKI